MSAEAVSAAFKHSESKMGARLVLMALANRADEHGIAWPGVDELAHRARLSRRGAQMALRKLEELGELVKLEDGGGRANTPLYWIRLPGLDGDVKGADRRRRRGRKGEAGNTERAKETTVKGEVRDGHLIEEPPRNHQEELSGGPSSRQEPIGFSEWLGRHAAITEQSVPRAGTDARAKLAKRFLNLAGSGYALEDFTAASRGCWANEWHRSKGVCRPQHVMRGDWFDGFIDAGRKVENGAGSIYDIDRLTVNR